MVHSAKIRFKRERHVLILAKLIHDGIAVY